MKRKLAVKCQQRRYLINTVINESKFKRNVVQHILLSLRKDSLIVEVQEIMVKHNIPNRGTSINQRSFTTHVRQMVINEIP